MSTQLFEEEAPQANTPRSGRGSRTATAEVPAPPAEEAPVEVAPLVEETPLLEATEEEEKVLQEVAPPAPKAAPVSIAAPAPVATVGPRPLPDDRASFTHTLRMPGVEGLLIVGLFDDGTPGEVVLVLRQASASARETLGAFADALNVALPYGVPLASLSRSLAALVAPGEAHRLVETLCSYLETRFSK